jgi:hypothetical protein
VPRALELLVGELGEPALDEGAYAGELALVAGEFLVCDGRACLELGAARFGADVEWVDAVAVLESRNDAPYAAGGANLRAVGACCRPRAADVIGGRVV